MGRRLDYLWISKRFYGMAFLWRDTEYFMRDRSRLFNSLFSHRRSKLSESIVENTPLKRKLNI